MVVVDLAVALQKAVLAVRREGDTKAVPLGRLCPTWSLVYESAMLITA